MVSHLKIVYLMILYKYLLYKFIYKFQWSLEYVDPIAIQLFFPFKIIYKGIRYDNRVERKYISENNDVKENLNISQKINAEMSIVQIIKLSNKI